MSMESQKKLRATKKGIFSRICNVAETIIASNGSRTQLQGLLEKISEALDRVTEANDALTSELEDDSPEIELSGKYMQDVEERHTSICEKIKAYLEARKNDALSETGSHRAVSSVRSLASGASNRSTAAKEAQIGARLKQLQVEQLDRRLDEERLLEEAKSKLEQHQREMEQRQREMEQRQREIERTARLAEARDAAELAAKEADLRQAAESELQWERMNDFDGEEAAQPDRSRGNETRSNDDSGKPDDAVAPMGHSVAECSTAQESDQTTGATATDNPDRPATETRRKEMQICNSEPRRTASATSWISEMTSKSQDEASAEQYRPGGHHRSVPQIQLPKFSGRATE